MIETRDLVEYVRHWLPDYDTFSIEYKAKIVARLWELDKLKEKIKSGQE